MKPFLALGILLIFAQCSEDDPSPFGNVQLSMTSQGSTTLNNGGRIANGRTNQVIEITDFQISIRDVIFKTDMDDDGVSDDSTEVAFRGPYAIDLLDDTDALTQTIGSAEIPVGTYQELRFKFHKTRDVASDHPLYDRSIFVKGTIDGVPFEMWHDTSENLDIGRSTGVTVDEDGINIAVTFTIDQFLNAAEAVDLSGAIDANQDGIIEINPDNDDDNSDLADALKKNIKAAADILDLQ